MSNMQNIKVMNKYLLTLANNRAIKQKFNRVLKSEYVEELSDATYPIIGAFVDKGFVRCNIIVNDRLDEIYLDVPFDMYINLPERAARF